MDLPEDPEGQRRPDGGRRPVGWRLVSANNRELGRCTRSFEDLVACEATVVRLRERVTEVRALFVMADAPGAWTWRIELDGRDVATAGRSYQRQRECQYNVKLFLAAVPVAQLGEGLVSRPRLRGLHLPGPARSARPEAEAEEPPLAPAGARAGAGVS
ncbi:hypothetical protein AB0D74_02440 [Streptomyces sp. NPDC048278]|uniref:hypothetical protein n=1 Tax=unclassified Streptomyces TaxID=2593676 RepID=UPI003444A1FF